MLMLVLVIAAVAVLFLIALIATSAYHIDSGIDVPEQKMHEYAARCDCSECQETRRRWSNITGF